MRVTIANEHYLLRESLRMLLQTNDGYQIVAESTDESSLLQALAHQPTDILLCDSGLPCRDLATMIERVYEIQPDLELVLFTEALNARQLKRQFSSSVAVIIDKENAGEIMLETLNQLALPKTAFKDESENEQALNI